MIGFTGKTDQDGKQQFTWSILGYEMKQARHSFIGLSLNTENSVSNVADTRLIKRDQIIHKDEAKYAYYCRSELKKKAFYCPSTHLMVITNAKV